MSVTLHKSIHVIISEVTIGKLYDKLLRELAVEGRTKQFIF